MFKLIERNPVPVSGPMYPALGSFLRPVGPYCYCFQVVKIIAWGDCVQWTFKRWGLNDDNKPFNDGHHSECFHNDLVNVLPGVWKDLDPCDWGVVRYFRLIEQPGVDVPSQLGLF